jgi:sugar-specific transcriptional regulator TrmB
MKDTKTKDHIQALRKTGLTHEESQIYFTLIQHGKKGTYIKDLTEHLSIKRTTIYSILNRLIAKGCVNLNRKLDGPKGAKIFSAISPKLYMDKIIRSKKLELAELEETKINILDDLELIYLKNREFSIDEVDDFLKPYLDPLYKIGWKVINYYVEKSKITQGFEAYDTTLLIPTAKVVKDAGFIVFKHDHDVENDSNTLNYMFDLLSKKGKEEVLRKDLGVVEIDLIEKQFKIKGKFYRGHLPKFKFDHSNNYVQMTESVMIPFKNKVFFLWAENHEFILKMAETIFQQD